MLSPCDEPRTISNSAGATSSPTRPPGFSPAINVRSASISAPSPSGKLAANVLPQYSRGNQSLCVVYPSHRQVSPAVKAFVTSVMRKFEQAFALHGP